MNKETAKQKAIREAYGPLYEKYNKGIDKNGYCRLSIFVYGDVEKEARRNGLVYDKRSFSIDNSDIIWTHIRPKILKGIEDNNGWVLSEEIPDNFSGMVWAKSGDIIEIMDVVNGHFYAPEIGREYTHYQRITKPEPPIY